MEKYCDRCDRPLQEGDNVRFVGLSVYHRLTSRVAWALEKDFEVIGLEHAVCADNFFKEDV